MSHTIKVCPNPQCDAVYHYCVVSNRYCPDCGTRIMFIDDTTYWNRFSKRDFQYDIRTMEYYYPKQITNQLSLKL